jgi:hypothetical protein
LNTWMRNLLWIPLAIVVVIGLGAAVCRASGMPPHLREALIAACACLLVSELGLVPVWVARGSDVSTLAPAALVATLVHLFGNVLVAAVVLLGRLPLHTAFVFWLTVMYWVTLIVLVVILVRLVRAAPAAGASGRR